MVSIHHKDYQSDNMDTDDNWEVEKHLLKTTIQELESALDKSKKFHRKFVDDVIESEEIRNQDFDRMKKELIAVNKRQVNEIRALTKDKKFYEDTCNALIEEKERSNTENSNQSPSVDKRIPQTKCSTNESLELTTKSRAGRKRSCSDSKYKMSTKLFEDNKKLKEKLSKVTKANATLRQRVKQLENFKSKIQSRNQQQATDQQELEDLLLSTTPINSQIFNSSALSQLDRFSRMQEELTFVTKSTD